MIKLEIIKTGWRLEVFKSRNLIFFLSILSFLGFVITVGFSHQLTVHILNLGFMMVAVGSLVIAALLSLLLHATTVAGCFEIGESIVFISRDKSRVAISKIEIVLNADEVEFSGIMKNLSANTVCRFGNQINAPELSRTETYEVLISIAEISALISKADAKIQFRPMFVHRPLTMTPPSKIMKTAYFWFLGWR